MRFFTKRKKSYSVNKDTMIILPSDSTVGGSKVIEINKEISLKENALQLINTACLKTGATIEDREMIVSNITGITHGTPIPINHQHNLYALPTNSPYHPECCWIFPAHVGRIIANKNNRKQSIILFKNKLALIVDGAPYILHRQMHRYSYCKIVLTKRMESCDDKAVFL